YLWQDGSTGQYFYAADSATYWVEVSDTSGCILYDSIYFDDEYYPLISLPDDTILCPGESLFLTAGDSSYTYLWSNGQTNSSIIAERQHYYHVTVANVSCISKDSIVLDYHSLGNETDYWYFGGNSGIYFLGGSVSALNDGVMDQTEGCASISDANGNLLFYTNGISVWNRLHIPMLNGTGLNGSSDATNSALIVKKPGSINIYYIFTLDNVFGSIGLSYSVVDMDEDISYGDVVQKNISLLTTASEKMTAVKHNNNQDVWLITHAMNTNTFYSYLVTSSGVNNNAVMSNSGSIYNNWQYGVGCIKASPDGQKLAAAYHLQAAGFCELFDFDNFTGIVSNTLVLDDYKWPYGVEFSPDNTKLYVSERMLSRIRQIDLLAGSPTDIVNSAVVISKTISSPPFALQIGIDGKIYVAKMTSPYLGVINSPDNIGMSCNYLDDGVFLGGSISKLGLPSFVQSYFNLPNFTHSNFCLGDYTYFSIQDSVDIDSVLWNFGDPIAGILNYSNLFNPVHYYDTAGVYDVKLKIYSKCKVDSINKPIIIYAVPQVYLGNDTLIHAGDSVVLYAGGFQNASYYWLPNGETTQSITAVSPAHYILVVTDTISGCSVSDTIKVYVQNDNCLFDVDFNTWLQQGDTANGKWNVSPLGDFVYQTVNSDLTFFVSPDDFINVKISGNMRVYSNWDDDYVGFVFGYKSPNDSTVNQDYEFLLFDWKQSTQVIASTPPITAYEGFSLVEVNGLISNYEISDFFWSHSDDPRFQIIDTLYGSPYGWNDYQTYHFDLTYTTSYVVIVIDNDTIFNVKGCFQPGRFGLYNYSQAYVEFSDFSYQLYTDFEFTDVCFGEENHFSSLDSNCLPIPGQLVFWDWDFGDGSYSDKVNPSYTYQNHGIFPVTLKITDHLGCADSVTKEITVFPLPDTQLANDTNLCTGSSVLLDPGSGYISYLWQDGSTNQTFITDTAGVFFLDVIDNNNCLGSDTIVVNLIPLPEPDLGNDTLICYGDTILLDPGMGYSSYLWQDGNTAQIFPASNSDIYWVQVIDSNLCSTIDSITITTEYCSVVTVLLDSFRVCPDTLIINVIIRNMTNTGAISLIMFYDNSILNYIGYQNLHPTLISGSYALNGGGGTFGMSWYSMMPVDIYDDTLFELVFYFNGGSSDLSWDTLTTGNCEFGDIGGNI
ncbi:MAG: hypothetical protein K8S00_10055, partial [Bacteroidales bacterium]|nr:hypothetical protein [Bacteroidales bacterium]